MYLTRNLFSWLYSSIICINTCISKNKIVKDLGKHFFFFFCVLKTNEFAPKSVRGPASSLDVSGMENGKRDYRSHQGASRNGPWERLVWTQRTLGRVNEKNETPRRFGSISVQRIPISGFGLWTVSVALFWGRIMSHKHKNLSYLLASTFKKF